MTLRNNSKILSQVVFRKINEQNILKQSFTLNRNAKDKKSATTTAKKKQLKQKTKKRD